MAKGVGTLLEKWQLFQVISFSFLLLSFLVLLPLKQHAEGSVFFNITPLRKMHGACKTMPVFLYQPKDS